MSGPENPASIPFSAKTPTGFQGDPNDPQLVVLQDVVTYWASIRSIELGLFRDDVRVDDIGIRTMGVSQRDGKLHLKFQLLDSSLKPKGETVRDHAYRIEATLNFL